MCYLTLFKIGTDYVQLHVLPGITSALQMPCPLLGHNDDDNSDDGDDDSDSTATTTIMPTTIDNTISQMPEVLRLYYYM